MNSELEKLMTAYADAWKRGDQEAAIAFWSDDIVMHAPGNNPLSGTYRGKNEVRRQLIDRIFEITDGRAEVLAVLERAIGNQHVFAIVHERFGRPDGRVFETKRVLVYRFVNGEIVEVRFFDPDQAAADAFWSAP